MTERMDSIIADLEGTCQRFADVLSTYEIKEDDLSFDELQQLDDSIYCCSNCGWWSESGDQDEDGNCSDCQEDD